MLKNIFTYGEHIFIPSSKLDLESARDKLYAAVASLHNHMIDAEADIFSSAVDSRKNPDDRWTS